ncbi:CheR family methyltransferase [Tuwongella immobilis]|uniref:protein-glutamate O-methyltransferase n=1 Tax=Tuwongella immobilis TaxID=692036 RepID=A0A6C2YMW4_9BACT|nr:protein-glutamate O-methyltransferase CheR [Tuwongella immobilis]VIP02252.1 chemotaxis protein : MCP methyltransferase, CheR-type OS=Desulfovibrio hydrothermalis AM13 = DSM 14728 GN=DESAM_23162 PE=4 SV=1: CheR_N: CheR [Tuwongella immobilis]VTS00843.1 chemotaxis protein : MCP methyltransferase, CheR-type OS=Desulfovibrio hydrothermalis AM13 = DSM 14728 GN=DESAM_23162 PE=4 SV=1: CheR_N: CheR [Tuwongella immobilis]
MILTEHASEEIRQQIHRLCGIHLQRDKDYLLVQRLSPLLAQHECRNWEELANRLRGSAVRCDLHQAVVEAITTPETSFFRDGHPFEAIRQQILPPHLASGHGMRIWSVACSTGQEPYSIAMLLRELRATTEGLPRISADRITATDISQRCLSIAQAGIYTPHEVQRGLSEIRLHRHFRPVGTNWQIRDEMRQMVQFSMLNLIESWPDFVGFDLILCRNVLIYFDLPTRTQILRRLCQLLPIGGWLILGAAENLLQISLPLEPVRVGLTTLYRRSG